MNEWVVRWSKNYSTVVEAENGEDAIYKATMLVGENDTEEFCDGHTEMEAELNNDDKGDE